MLLKVHLNVHGIEIQFLCKFESHFIFILPILSFSLSKDNKEGRALFPRIEYTNEWLPVGRGDPLKDPTYDYMPPVLDRVRYWADGTSQKNKNDVLVLGVPSKKLSANKPKDKFNYGPIKRTYYSPPYQSHFSSPHHHQQPQQQQYVSNEILYSSVNVFSLKTLFYFFTTAPSAVDATAEACNRLVSHVNTPLST